MALTAQQLMALKQALMQKQGLPQDMPAPHRAMPPAMTKQPSHPGAAPGAYGYDQGGAVDPQDAQATLAPYMPTDAEAAASGFPPGPQRKTYIAQQRKNAADAQSIAKDSSQPIAPGYEAGGKVSSLPYFGPHGKYQAALDKEAGRGETTNGPNGKSVDTEDAAEAAEEETKANPPKNVDINGNPYFQGGEIDKDQLSDLLSKSGQPIQAKEIKTGTRTPYSNEAYDKEKSDEEVSNAKGYADGGDVDEAVDASAPAAEEAPLQTSMAEALASKDPQALRRVLESTRQSSQEAPYDAAEDAAQTARAARTAELDKVLGKQAVQDVVDKQSIPDRSAKDSAKTLMRDEPKKEALEEAAEDAAEGAAGEGGEEASMEAAASKIPAGLAKALGLAAGIAIPSNSLASTGDSKATPIPGMPGKYMKGQDIVSMPDSDSRDDLSDVIGPNSSSMPPQDPMAAILAGSGGGTPSSSNPALTQMLAKRAALMGRTPAVSQNASSAPASSQAESPVAAANIAPQNDIGSLLDKLGLGSSADARLAQLQAQKQKMLQSNAMQMGGDTISRAFARGRGAQMAPNTEYYNQMNAMANAPVEAEMQRRGVIKDAMDTGVKASDFLDKQQTRDPASPVSAAFRSMALTWNPALKDTPGFDKMDAEGIKQMLPGIDMQVKRDYMIQDTKLRAAQAADARQSSNDFKQTNNFNQTIQQLESQRSTNPAVGQAEKDLYAAQKAQTIQKLAPNGDLNQLSPQMAQLLNSEVAKIAKGGVSDREELQALNPGTLQGTLAKYWQKLSNDPSPANAGAFLQQYQDYAGGVAKDAQKVITDHYSRVINSRANQFTPEQKGYLQDNYLGRFGQSNEGAKSNAIGSYTPDVMNYAKAHNITNEQALQVKQQRTGQ